MARMENDGKPYISLQLRYEKGMIAFNGCAWNLTFGEAEELHEIRYNLNHWIEKYIDVEEKCKQGSFPLTPHETSFLFKSLGYSPTTNIYIALGEIYGIEIGYIVVSKKLLRGK